MQTVHEARYRIGDSVAFFLGGRRVSGLVVEDRGPLALGGRHLYRVLVPFPAEEPASLEMPEDELALHGARSALFEEMAKRTGNKWRQLPVGVLVDFLDDGFPALERTVFDACLEVAERVRTESAEVARDLGLDTRPVTSAKANAVTEAQHQAHRVSRYAGEHGFEGLHEEIERALWEAAVKERDRVLRVADEREWRDLERVVRNPDAQRERYPFLALIAGWS